MNILSLIRFPQFLKEISTAFYLRHSDESDEPRIPSLGTRMCDVIDFTNSRNVCPLPSELICELTQNKTDRIKCEDGKWNAMSQP